MADIKDWMATAAPDAEWEETVKTQMNGVAPDLGLFPDIPSLRTWITNAKLAAAAQMGGDSVSGVDQADHQVSMRDGHKITCRVYKPSTPPSGGSPLFVAYHGGGWCIGGLENEEMLCRRAVAELGVVAVNVDYRLAPEWKFPFAVEDCWDATKWAAAKATDLGADPSKGFIIGGTSAGGNLTAIVSLLARDEKLSPAITGTLLMIPFYVHHKAVPEHWKADYRSWEQNKYASILSQKACTLFVSNYLEDEDKAASDPRMSPGLWPTGLAGLPPAFFQICGQDPLRDEALIVEREMREKHKTTTKVLMYSGQPHGFWSVVPTMEASKKFVTDSVGGIKWLLEQK